MNANNNITMFSFQSLRRGLLAALTVLAFTPVYAETLTYEYDFNGNVLVRQTPTRTETAGYDALDRMTLDISGDGLVREFIYDDNGNRTQYKVDTFSETLTYAESSNRLTQRGTQVIQIDLTGNITDDGQFQYLYNSHGRLTEVWQGPIRIAAYTYNADGQRIVKETAQGTTVYHYDEEGHLIAETKANGSPVRDYVWVDNLLIAQIDTTAEGEVVTYLHTDHLGTPRVGSDALGNVVWRWRAEAFGSLLSEEDPDQNGVSTTVNVRFPGAYYDAETGLFYVWNRYYDPRTGRWITSDPIGLAAGLNTYVAIENNPLRYVDPTGTSALAEVITGGGILLCWAVPSCKESLIKASKAVTDACVNAADKFGDMLGDLIFAKPPADPSKRPPAGSLPIDQTPWSGDHRDIKAGVGAGAADNVKISPNGDVWVENPDGTWVNAGPAGDYTGSGEASGQRGKDRDRSKRR